MSEDTFHETLIRIHNVDLNLFLRLPTAIKRFGTAKLLNNRQFLIITTKKKIKKKEGEIIHELIIKL